MKIKIILALFCVVAFVEAQTKDFVAAELKEESAIAVVFSKNSHNRISWKGGSIVSITGDKQTFSVEINQDIGQAFVHLLRDLEKAPSTLTVVSSTGFVQDLLVSSADKPSTHISIQEPKEEEEDFVTTYVDFHAQTIDFLNAILDNKTPLGYGERSIQDTDKLQLPQPLESKVLKALEGAFETIIVYRLTNMGQKPIHLHPSILKQGEVSWVFLHARELAHREFALCILAKSKEEG